MTPLAVALAALLAGATELSASAPIDRVTIYRSSARVVRTAKVDLPAGDVQLVLGGLTASLSDDSVRVTGSGAARVRLLGASVEQEAHAEALSPEVRAAEAALQKLLDAQAEIDDDRLRAKARFDFASSIGGAASTRISQSLVVRLPEPRALAALADALSAQMKDAQAKMRGDDARTRALSGQIQAARAALDAVRGIAGRTTKAVRLALSVAKPGAYTVQLAYLVGGGSSSWSPVWDARLTSAEKQVELSLRAAVRQTTGEDWRGVAVALSTAEPNLSPALPPLEPDYLERARFRGLPAPMAARAPIALVAPEPSAPSEALATPAATLIGGLVSERFVAPSRATVRADGEPRELFLASWKLSGELTRVAEPITGDSAAHVTFEGANPGPGTLLAGPVSLWVDGQLSGRAQLPGTPTGEKLRLAFGEDPGIHVERRVLERKRSTEGFLSKRDRIVYQIRTVARNDEKASVKLDLIDRIPVSQEKEIEVRLLDGSDQGEPFDPMRPGLLHFALSLAPGEERAVELRYEVSWPAGQAIEGLP